MISSIQFNSNRHLLVIALVVLVGVIYAIWSISTVDKSVSDLNIEDPFQSEQLSQQATTAPEDKPDFHPAGKERPEESDSEMVQEFYEEPTAAETLAATIEGLRERIAKDGKSLEHPITGSDDDYLHYRTNMAMALESDPSLLGGLIDLFLADPNSLLGREVSSVLSETGAPEVQTAALDIGLNSYHYSHDERAAALFTVANMETVTGDTRDRLLDSLATEQDSEMLQFSLIAMKPAPSTQEDYSRVQETLSTTIESSDENVRRHAAYQMEKWATSNEDLAPLRTMAMEEQDINARARAILSIGDSPFKSDENRAVLWSAVNNKQEMPHVRQAAWESLRSYPHSSSELEDYHEIGDQIEQAVSAEFERSE